MTVSKITNYEIKDPFKIDGSTKRDENYYLVFQPTLNKITHYQNGHDGAHETFQVFTPQEREDDLVTNRGAGGHVPLNQMYIKLDKFLRDPDGNIGVTEIFIRHSHGYSHFLKWSMPENIKVLLESDTVTHLKSVYNDGQSTPPNYWPNYYRAI